MSAENPESHSGSDQLIEELQSRYRSDRWSSVGKRFGYTPRLTRISANLDELLEKSKDQRSSVENPDLLDREASDRLVDVIASRKKPL